MEAYDHRSLDSSAKEIVDHAKRTNARVCGPIPMPTRVERYTVLRSPHIDKKSRPTAGPGAPFERASDPVVAFDRKHKNLLENTIAVSDAGCAVYCDSADVVNISSSTSSVSKGETLIDTARTIEALNRLVVPAGVFVKIKQG